MDGPRITLIRPPILSDPIPGMSRDGTPGINAILITGRISNKDIPIGADITLVSVMTRIFITSTIVAMGKVGIKDSMASVLLEPLVPAFVALELLFLVVLTLEPLLLGFVNLEKLLMVRKNIRNSPPTGASSQIAQPGRSGIIIKATSRIPFYDH